MTSDYQCDSHRELGQDTHALKQMRYWDLALVVAAAVAAARAAAAAQGAL